MRINFRIIWLALPLVFGACSDSSDADTRPAAETISVSVGSGPKIDIESEDKSRTQLGEDGVSVKWASDDQIALWAVNSRSETVFSKQAFKLYHYNTDYNTAKFRGDIPQMPADTYTYYAVSPVPSESDGTQATYLIPDVQDGGFNGDWDVMVADPVKAPALEKNDTGETVQFQFRHKVHVLKIRIPKNDLGEKVSEITLAFPQPVTGRMTVDAADPDAAPTLTGSNNTLTLRFDTPKDAGDVVFAVIAPVELTAEQPVTITAICEAGESEPRNIPGKHFSEGHTTPIAYHIPAIGRYYTRLNFSLPADKGTATLGEAVGKITLTAPEGSLFDNGTNICQFTPDAEGKYTMVLKPSWTDNLSGKAVTVQYESESAVVSNTLTMPQITEFGNNDITFSVPYLLAEDFSNIIQFDYDCNVGTGTSSSSAGNKDAHLLSDKGAIGWTAARVGGETGKCIRSSCRFEGGGVGKASSYARYPGAGGARWRNRLLGRVSGRSRAGHPRRGYGKRIAPLFRQKHVGIHDVLGQRQCRNFGTVCAVDQTRHGRQLLRQTRIAADVQPARRGQSLLGNVPFCESLGNGQFRNALPVDSASDGLAAQIPRHRGRRQ